ncbi:hypothetical protein [Albimonas pacifica]|uniref:Uncharacterized protein n=1 Tax=Albimonas pacifica TaxID=1114924 RepID=A0A1I3F472_9RHOB|nr:hypothetical protein [Albimonas pacifica]SFI05992.1 hypothetical protein SAMN05216258_10456 [Albimonas pacifica]
MAFDASDFDRFDFAAAETADEPFESSERFAPQSEAPIEWDAAGGVSIAF